MGRKRSRKNQQPTASSSPSSSSPARKKLKWGAERYSSCHHLLLVGEGDFSFSLSLANTFGSAFNIVATSKDSHDVVQAKYGNATKNLDALKKMGAQILHEVDATVMDVHNDLKMHQFDRIIFNFPHAGFMGKEDQTEMINLHRQLVLGFFKAAAKMLKPHGEIHVSHKIGYPYDKWELGELANSCFLQLIECSEFKSTDYPGYANKRGAGKSPDLAFRLGPCGTFKFKVYDAREKLNSLRKILVPGRVQGSTGVEFNVGEIPKRYPFLAIQRDYCASIEQNYLQRGSASMRTRDLLIMNFMECEPGRYSDGKIILDADLYCTMRRNYCPSLLIRQNYMPSGGYGIPLSRDTSLVKMRDDISVTNDVSTIKQNYMQSGGYGIPNYMQSGGYGIPLSRDMSLVKMRDDISCRNDVSTILSFPGAPVREQNGYCYRT